MSHSRESASPTVGASGAPEGPSPSEESSASSASASEDRASLSVTPDLRLQRPAAVWRARPSEDADERRPRRDSTEAPVVPAAARHPRGAYAWVLPRRLLFFLEALATSVAVLVAWGVLLDWRWLDSSLDDAAMASHSGLLAGMSVVLFTGLLWDGAFSAARRISGIDDGLLVFKHLAIAVVVTFAAALVTRGFGTGYVDYSARVVAAYIVLVVVLTAGAVVAAYSWQRRMFHRGEGVRHVVIVGAGAAASEFERFLMKHRWLGVRCTGIVSVLSGPTESQRLGGLILVAPVLGDLRDLSQVVRRTDASEVVVALDEDERATFPRLARLLAAEEIPFRVLPGLFQEGYAPACAAGLNGLPTVALRVESGIRAQRAAKRVVDVLVSLTVLVVTVLPLALVALLVKLTSPGPVFFHQERVGHDGRTFDMVKLRSMYVNAESRLSDLLPLNEADGALFKMKDDPRVTPVGRFLRRWSIDELPQFWNVLRGDMSIVGPRPPLAREVTQYEAPHLARLMGKPGITGLWQVSGRSELTFEQMVELDRSYLEHWSLGLDISIMLRTALAIMRRKGAY